MPPNTEQRPDGTIIRIEYIFHCTDCNSDRAYLLVDRKITGWTEGEISFNETGPDEHSWGRTGDDDYEYGEYEDEYRCTNCDAVYARAELAANITRRETVVPARISTEYAFTANALGIGRPSDSKEVQAALKERPWIAWRRPHTYQQIASLTKKQRELYESEKPEGEDGSIINAPDHDVGDFSDSGVECPHCHKMFAIDISVRFRRRDDSLVAGVDLCPHCGKEVTLPTNQR